jgi:hypothetical protein
MLFKVLLWRSSKYQVYPTCFGSTGLVEQTVQLESSVEYRHFGAILKGTIGRQVVALEAFSEVCFITSALSVDFISPVLHTVSRQSFHLAPAVSSEHPSFLWYIIYQSPGMPGFTMDGQWKYTATSE